MLFRIFTELKNEKTLLDLVSKSFEGFTAYKTTGFWRGVQERSICFEFITDNAVLVYKLADSIKTANNQESVLVEELRSTANFI